MNLNAIIKSSFLLLLPLENTQILNLNDKCYIRRFFFTNEYLNFSSAHNTRIKRALNLFMINAYHNVFVIKLFSDQGPKFSSLKC